MGVCGWPWSPEFAASGDGAALYQQRRKSVKTRRVLVALAIVAGLGILLTGCTQSDEQAETSSCSDSADGISITCEGKDGELECVVTCSGTEGSLEYIVTCEGHDGSRECTVTCEGTEGGADCTVTCEGADGKRGFTITCDGETVTCEHADGEACTCQPAATSGCPGMIKTADAGGTCQGMAKTPESGGSCARSAGSSCPGSASTVAEGFGR